MTAIGNVLTKCVLDFFVQENWLRTEGPSLANTAFLPVTEDTPWESDWGGAEGHHHKGSSSSWLAHAPCHCRLSGQLVAMHFCWRAQLLPRRFAT
jgi:hypothetical protein